MGATCEACGGELANGRAVCPRCGGWTAPTTPWVGQGPRRRVPWSTIVGVLVFAALAAGLVVLIVRVADRRAEDDAVVAAEQVVDLPSELEVLRPATEDPAGIDSGLGPAVMIPLDDGRYQVGGGGRVQWVSDALPTTDDVISQADDGSRLPGRTYRTYPDGGATIVQMVRHRGAPFGLEGALRRIGDPPGRELQGWSLPTRFLGERAVQSAVRVDADGPYAGWVLVSVVEDHLVTILVVQPGTDADAARTRFLEQVAAFSLT